MARTIPTIERPQLAATLRTIVGSRAIRRLRHDGLIPGVVYGKSTKPMSVTVNGRELTKLLHARTGGEHSLVTLSVEQNGKHKEQPVIIHDVQHDPVRGGVTHIDFHAIVLTEQIRIKVPLVLAGDAVGVKQESGVLEQFLREIEVECLPTAIPHQVAYDVSAMKIGDTVHVRDLAVPSGVKVLTDAEGAVASVLMPRVEKPAEVTDEAAVTEPEVLREKKPEAEDAEAGKDAKAEKKGDKPVDKKDEK